MMTNQTNEQMEMGKPEMDQAKSYMVMQEIKANQNFMFGMIGGIIAATIGAIIWAIITALTNFQIGWMAVGVGFLVGFAVRIYGKGLDSIFGIMGAILSLLGCLAGNLFASCIVLSKHQSIPILDLLSRLNLDIIVKIMTATFSPIDLLFYGIAIYEGYKFSFRKISVTDHQN
jgi:hypothetical protein